MAEVTSKIKTSQIVSAAIDQMHVMAEASGKPWNTRAVICEDGSGADEALHSDAAHAEVVLIPGTRHAASAVVHIPLPGR